MTPCSLVDGFRSFEEIYFLYLQDGHFYLRWSHYVSPNCRSLCHNPGKQNVNLYRRENHKTSKEKLLSSTDLNSESELLYDWRFSANQFVLASSPSRPTTRDLFSQLHPCSHSPYVTTPLTTGWVCQSESLFVVCFMLVSCPAYS
jgi:hypothetical protein